MGIKNLPRRLNSAGNIKIGMKGAEVKSATTGTVFRPPSRLDHFILTTTERDGAGDFVIDTALMDKIKESGRGLVNEAGNIVGIPVRLLYEATDLNFPTRYASYVSGKLSCTGDGEFSQRRLDDFKVNHACPCPRLDAGYDGKDKCKPNGKLTCVIDEANLFGQVHVFRTTSINSVMGILGGLDLLRAATKGHVSGIPLMLVVNNKSTVIPGSGAPTTVQVVSLCYRGDMMALRESTLQLLEQDRRYLLGMDELQAEARANGVGDVVAPTEEAEFVDEFMPDQRAEIGGGQKTAEVVVVDEQKPAEQEESATDMLAGPALQDAAAVDRLIQETDLKSAIAMANRLKKSDLIYFLKDQFPGCVQDETGIKPVYVGMAVERLTKKLAPPVVVDEPATTFSNEHPFMSACENPFMTELWTIAHTNRQVDVVNAIRNQFPGRIINGTLPIPDLIILAEKLLEEDEWEKQKDEKAEVKETVEADQDSAQPAEDSAGGASSENIEVGDSVPKNPEDLNPIQASSQVADWRRWDDGPEISRDQKIEIVRLKKALEVAGKSTPETWANSVALFIDKDGAPLTSAVTMTGKQAGEFIVRLGNMLHGDNLPF